MRRRCSRLSAAGYEKYGACGIKVCARWQESFEAFLADVGRRPTPLHTLEREDANGDYEPGNVIWTTRRERARNRHAARMLTRSADLDVVVDEIAKLGGAAAQSQRNMLTAFGISIGVKEAAKIAGVTRETIRQRILRGWPVEQILGPRSESS